MLKKRKKKKNEGSMLLELLVGLSLIALLTTLSLVYLPVFSSAAVRSHVHRFVADCAYLQRMAMVSGQKKSLHIDVDHHAYTFQGERVAGEWGVCFGTVPGAQGPPSDPHTEIKYASSFGDNTIIFYPDGKMRPGSLYLTDTQHRVGYAVTVPISHVSTMYTYRYTAGHWERI